MTDILEQYQNGYDAVVEMLLIELDVPRAAMRASVVFRAVRVTRAREHWVRIQVRFSKLEVVRLGHEWLEGGGAILYDGGTLNWSEESATAVLNFDPGVAWRATGQQKPTEASSALLSGSCEITIEEIPAE
ncbi:MAG: hypothetical protein Q8N26_07075 [Myxococcales bacterium]|nr:hypothetical protein [Myxococcales bacterium]